MIQEVLPDFLIGLNGLFYKIELVLNQCAELLALTVLAQVHQAPLQETDLVDFATPFDPLSQNIILNRLGNPIQLQIKILCTFIQLLAFL